MFLVCVKKNNHKKIWSFFIIRKVCAMTNIIKIITITIFGFIICKDSSALNLNHHNLTINNTIISSHNDGYKIAAVHWLPDFQGSFASRNNEGGNSGSSAGTCANYNENYITDQPDSSKYDFTTKSNVDGKGLKCYTNVRCKAKFSYAVDGCDNGQTADDYCETNGVKKYTCKDCSDKITMINSGWSLAKPCAETSRLRTNSTSCANYYNCCNSGFNATDYPKRDLNATQTQKIEEQAGQPTCKKLVDKTCTDHNSDYKTSNDTNKSCTKAAASEVGSLECWSCSDCASSFNKTDATCKSEHSGFTNWTATKDTSKICGGKASECICSPSGCSAEYNQTSASSCQYGSTACNNGCENKYKCKAEIKCEAPYYKNAEENCVLWDGVAALVKTCSDLITTTKNGNITGNILIWGTLNCGENAITLQQGQNLVGRAFFSGKYPEATDSNTNKFSQITWDARSQINALSVEHNSKLHDLTLSINSASKTSPNLIYINGKQNLVFKNLDLHGKIDSSDYFSIKIIEALNQTSMFAFQGNSYIRTDTTINKGSPRWVTQGKMSLGQDSVLNIVANGGAGEGFDETTTTMTKNAVMNIKTDGITYSMIFTGDDMNAGAKLGSLTLSDTATINADVTNAFVFIEVPLTMSGNSVINAKTNTFFDGSSAFGTNIPFRMNDYARINVQGKTFYGGSRDSLIMSGNSSVYAKGVAGGDGMLEGRITLNDNAKIIIEANDYAGGSMDGYYGVVHSYGHLTLNSKSKLFISSNDYIFSQAPFALNSSNALIYAKQINTSRRIFGKKSSTPEVWLYQTTANARFAIETPGQNGYGGAEDDGLYLMPALGVSSSDGSSTCSHMTGGYSSSKINRDLCCWTHDKDANPNNNDYFKGRQCDRCSPGYKLTGVTHLSKSDSRFTSAKSDFESEMSKLSSTFSNFLANLIP